MRGSKFIEKDAGWRIFRQAIRDAGAAFADVSPDDLQKMIDQAVEEVRSSESPLRKSGTHSVNYNP